MEKTRSHEEDNLVVLCLEHHGKAHTKHELSLNYTPTRIKEAKLEWEKEVLKYSAETVKEIVTVDSSVWDYMNIQRIYELVARTNINFESLKYFRNMHTRGYVDRDGFIDLDQTISGKGDLSHWADFENGFMVSLYMEELFNKLVASLNIKILNNIWNKTDILSFIRTGDIILLQGAFQFRKLNDKNSGKGQRRLAYRKAKGIKVEFEFDAWESVSNTSKCVHLTGRSVKTAIAIVRSISHDSELKIVCTVLGMGTGFNDISNGRFYPNAPFMYQDYSEEEYDEYEEAEETDGEVESESELSI